MRKRTDKVKLLTSANVRWNLTDWLFIQGKAGQDYYGFKNENIIPDGTGFRRNGQVDQRNISFWERNFEVLIGMDRALNENIGLNVNLGGNMMSQRRNT